MVLISKRKNEAPNRMKVRATSFHALILEQRGALKFKGPAKPDLSGWRCVGLTSGNRRGEQIPHGERRGGVGDDSSCCLSTRYIHVIGEKSLVRSVLGFVWMDVKYYSSILEIPSHVDVSSRLSNMFTSQCFLDTLEVG